MSCLLLGTLPLAVGVGFKLMTPDRSIVFSGDTRPSRNLVELAQGADVLVHEIMYLPGIEQIVAAEPNAKTLREHLFASHSTAEQVGRVASEADHMAAFGLR